MQKSLTQWGLSHIERYLKGHFSLFQNTAYHKLANHAAFYSFATGFIITLLLASAEVYFVTRSQIELNLETVLLLVLLNVGLIAIEFWLLFHIGFQACARYIQELEKQHPLNPELKHALVEAILELEESKTTPFNLDLQRHTPKHHWLSLLLYKFKVMLSNALAKLIINRLLSRSAARGYVPLISTVITGFWDAWVQLNCLKEVRLRLSAHLYTQRLIKTLQQSDYPQATRHVLIRIIAVRLELMGRYSLALSHMLQELETEQAGSVSGCERLFDPILMAQHYQALPILEQHKLAEIACALLAFKRQRLSKKEQHWLTLFTLNKQQLKQCRQQLDCPVRQSHTLITLPVKV
ncbi:MAG: hypothetical protein Q9N68_00615 [Gammaproteobacteria bacterium]|nr:hypothetical protein [Gammaproteobacteria bacterium]